MRARMTVVRGSRECGRKEKRRGERKESFFTSFCSPFATESKVSTLKET